MRAAPRTHALLALAILVALATTTTAPAAPQRKTACQRLKANNHDESSDAKLVLVTRGDDEYGTVYACVLPRGTVRRLATWDDGLGRDSYSVAGTAGTWVLVSNRYGDQYGGVSASIQRIDVRSGRSVTLAGYGCNAMFEWPCPTGTSYGTYAMASSGAGAIEIQDLGAHTHTLQAFGPSGQLTRLDDAPVQALRVTRTEIVWMRDGIEHRAGLPR